MVRNASDRGAALIHVTVILIGLFLFTGLVADYGTFWVGRNQVQNAADAGALAGETARIFDDTSSRPASTTSGKIYESVTAAVAQNYIWGQSPPANTVVVGWNCPQNDTTNCVVVDVYRDGTNNSTALPTFFLQLANITSQGTRAHAVAQALPANAVECLKPFMAPDKGTGVTYGLADVGTLLVLTASAGPSQFQQADLGLSGATNCQGTGAACYGYAITNCVNGSDTNSTWAVGDPIQTASVITSGATTAADVTTVYQQDTGASWDASTVSISGSCAPSSCGCANNVSSPCANGWNGRISPRIVDIAAFDPGALAGLGSGGGQLPIQNFLSVFLLQPGVGDPANPNNGPCVNPQNVCGYLVLSPGVQLFGKTIPATSTNITISIIR
jgi:hypothetical protein